jgi:hypothetical protein
LTIDSELRKKFGENGLTLIKEVYDYKKIITEMENILIENET